MHLNLISGLNLSWKEKKKWRFKNVTQMNKIRTEKNDTSILDINLYIAISTHEKP